MCQGKERGVIIIYKQATGRPRMRQYYANKISPKKSCIPLLIRKSSSIVMLEKLPQGNPTLHCWESSIIIESYLSFFEKEWAYIGDWRKKSLAKSSWAPFLKNFLFKFFDISFVALLRAINKEPYVPKSFVDVFKHCFMFFVLVLFNLVHVLFLHHSYFVGYYKRTNIVQLFVCYL